MAVISKIVNAGLSYRLKSIDGFRSKPFEAQHKMFRRLMRALSKTVYGREHGITPDTTYEEYVRAVPVVTYEDIEPYIHRMRKGEKNILWDAPVRWFAKSSGTTNDKSKFIPVTHEGLVKCHFRGGRDLLAISSELYPDSGMFTGKALILGGSHRIETLSEGKIRTGDVSAIMIENVPRIANLFRLPKKEIALIADFNKKIELICRTCHNKRVTMIAGVPSWNMVMLNKILECTGKGNISEVWPHLEMFFHGGTAFAPYEAEYRRLIPNDRMKYHDTYNASEGFFALQDEPDDRNMLLMLDYGVFYEFIPMSTYSDRTTAVPLEGVEHGVNYAIVISSINGLWRYMTGDTVTFTSTFPHKIKITGRTKLFINAFGEEVIIDNAESAISRASDATGAIVHEYIAAPVYMSGHSKGRHQWAIEFKQEPDDLGLFTEVLDKTLQEVNSDYEAKRSSSATLLSPEITILKPGTFMKWSEQRGKVGGQNKIPRLSNDRDHINEILSL